MNLYCIANIGRSIALSVNGGWISFSGTKSNLRNVCWFGIAADAQKYVVMFAPRNVSVVSAKTLMKKKGLKHPPGYVMENHKGSMLSRMIGKGQSDAPKTERGVEREKNECGKDAGKEKIGATQTDRASGARPAAHHRVLPARRGNDDRDLSRASRITGGKKTGEE